jgi:hypothetical protein
MSEWEDGRSSGTAPGPAWVSAADAADKAGTTPARVREWAQEGVIASQPSQGPLGEQILVRLEEVVERAKGEDPPRSDHPEPTTRVYNHYPTAELSPIFKTIPELVAQLTSATDRAARAETKVEFLSRQVGELKRQLATATDAPVPDDLPPELLETPAREPEPESAVARDPMLSVGEPWTATEDHGVDAPDATTPSTTLEGIWADEPSEREPSNTGRYESPRLPERAPRRRWWQRR